MNAPPGILADLWATVETALRPVCLTLCADQTLTIRATGLGELVATVGDTEAEAIAQSLEGLAARVRAKAQRTQAPATSVPWPTTFECRCCGAYVGGKTDGSFDAPGWGRIDRIDGPNAICPASQEDPTALDGLKADGYERAHVRGGK